MVKAEHYDYLKAEKLGEAGEPCKELYKECRQSLMDIFTQVYDSPLYKFDWNKIFKNSLRLLSLLEMVKLHLSMLPMPEIL